MNYKEKFEFWLSKKFGDKNGTKASYLKAIDLISEKIGRNIFYMNQLEEIKKLYVEVKQEQRSKDNKFYHSEAPSYGINGFYSAAMKNYLSFLEETGNNG